MGLRSKKDPVLGDRIVHGLLLGMSFSADEEETIVVRQRRAKVERACGDIIVRQRALISLAECSSPSKAGSSKEANTLRERRVS